MRCLGRVGVGHRNRRKQRPRVGMGWVREDRLGFAHLDDLAQVHHRHAAADMAHQPQVVGDEQVGQLQALLQVHQQVDHLCLDRHVERRHRLVGDDELRLERQRPGQADPLPLAAAELVRIALEVRRVEADEPEQLRDARDAFRPWCRACG